MFGFIGNIGPWELVMILLVALIVVGPEKLPEVARSLGKAVNKFQQTTSGVKREIQQTISFEDTPSQSARQINIRNTPKPTEAQSSTASNVAEESNSEAGEADNSISETSETNEAQ